MGLWKEFPPQSRSVTPASLLRLLFAPQPTILAISDATARVSVKEAGLGVYTVEPLYPDTNGAEENVVVSEVSSFQRLKESGKRCHF